MDPVDKKKTVKYFFDTAPDCRNERVKTALNIRVCIKGNPQIHQKAKTTDISSFYSGRFVVLISSLR